MANRIEPSRRHGPFDPRFRDMTAIAPARAGERRHGGTEDAPPDALSTWESEGGGDGPDGERQLVREAPRTVSASTPLATIR